MAVFSRLSISHFRNIANLSFSASDEINLIHGANGSGKTSILEAVGHAFFTLSLGMGAMITYGSYLRQDDDLVSTSLTVGILDTVERRCRQEEQNLRAGLDDGQVYQPSQSYSGAV